MLELRYRTTRTSPSLSDSKMRERSTDSLSIWLGVVVGSVNGRTAQGLRASQSGQRESMVREEERNGKENKNNIFEMSRIAAPSPGPSRSGHTGHVHWAAVLAIKEKTKLHTCVRVPAFRSRRTPSKAKTCIKASIAPGQAV